MNARLQVLEAEIKAVRVVSLTRNRQIARAANEREKELQVELQQIRKTNNKRSSNPHP